MSCRFSAALLAVLLAFSTSSHPQTRKMTLSGIVTDKQTHKPIEGATVMGNAGITSSPLQKENLRLIDDALDLARKIGQLRDDCTKKSMEERDRIRKELNTATEEDQRRIYENVFASVHLVESNAIHFYKNKYRRDAITLRDALLDKLAKGIRDEGIAETYEGATMCAHLELIANDLRRLAKLMQAESK
jgi:hypothetical protein